ncbi:MAG: GNAT family N-acetyltransferase [Candidatus Omnitrophica bacterium]|nr:GNAT family N-acetyltransferase [Candidatus Omnitrophota bacterium]
MTGVAVRKYAPPDRESVRQIAWLTAFMGEPADVFFDGKEVLADFLTLYFTDYEPQSCFVAEADNRIIGYLLGSTDTRRIQKVFFLKIATKILLKGLVSGAFFSRNNARFILLLIKSLFAQELYAPDFHAEFPATLHINIRKEYRGQGIGGMLVSSFLAYLQEHKVGGVCLSTMSEKATLFFEKIGFRLLYRANRSYFKNILGHAISVYTYGKRL